MEKRNWFVTTAIVGGGMAATFAARGFLHENAARGNQLESGRIVVIEPRQRAGVGTAWEASHSLMLTNMSVPTLRVYGGINPTYDGFEIRRVSGLIDLPAGQGALQPYVPRSIVGERLAQLFEETRPIAARAGMSLEHMRSTATRVSRDGSGFCVDLRNGDSLHAQCVVLALGLLPVDRYPELQGQPGYHANPREPGTVLAEISDDQRVGVIGMGPGAIDWVLQLIDRDFRQPMLMVSPSGRLPAVRPLSLLEERFGIVDSIIVRSYATKERLGPDVIDFIIFAILERFGVTPGHLHTYCTLFRGGGREMLERTLAESDREQPLFEAVQAIDRLVPTVWRWASEAGRAHIMTKWARIHALLSYAIPPSNATALLSLLDSGRLETKGGLIGARRVNGRFLLDLSSPSGDARVEPVDILINATGYEGRLGNVNNDLVQSMLASGLLCEAPYGGARMDYETGQVLDSNGRKIDGLFIAGGNLTRTAGYALNSIVRTSEHSISVGVSLARYLNMRIGRDETESLDGHPSLDDITADRIR